MQAPTQDTCSRCCEGTGLATLGASGAQGEAGMIIYAMMLHIRIA
jgi:hypothetical protein